MNIRRKKNSQVFSSQKKKNEKEINTQRRKIKDKTKLGFMKRILIKLRGQNYNTYKLAPNLSNIRAVESQSF